MGRGQRGTQAQQDSGPALRGRNVPGDVGPLIARPTQEQSPALRSRVATQRARMHEGLVYNGSGAYLHPDLFKITSKSMTPNELEDTLVEAQFVRYDAEAVNYPLEEWIDEDQNPWYALPKGRVAQADQAVEVLASNLHEEWRKGRLQNDGSFEPRVKDTKDEQWIAAHNGQREVDIANTGFGDLPSDWQAENHKAAEVAVGIVMYTESTLRGLGYESGLSRDDLHEIAASQVHELRLERNGEWAEPHQKVSYFDLSPEEKKKDRDQVESAFRILDKISEGALSQEKF